MPIGVQFWVRAIQDARRSVSNDEAGATDASGMKSRMPRILLVLLASAYLAGVWLDGVGSTLPSSILPRPANYFLQVSALFPYAALASIDYRAQGWVCSEGKWEELDTRPYFPIDADNKQNRFQRVMHFFREDRTTMHALEAYLVDGHNAGHHDDGIAPDAPIVGVRFLSVRIPLPRPGDRLTRSERLPLSEYPDSEKQSFYHTPKSKIDARCGGDVHETDERDRERNRGEVESDGPRREGGE